MSKPNNKLIIKFSFAFVVISIFLSTVVSIHSLRLMANDNQKDINMLLAMRIHDKINSELTEPVMAAKTMANNSFLLDFLENKESMEENQSNIEEMQAYLERLQTGLSYDSISVISNATKRYYTSKGVNKIIDIVNNPRDIWYSLFVNKHRDYDLDVDIDEANENTWAVFVNARIENQGKMLGVCRIAVRMTELQDIISEYEKGYDIKVNLIDSSGLVQVDTDEINIERAYLNEVNISAKDSNEYVYREGKDGEYIVSKYVKNLGWYLVVQSEARLMDRELLRVLLLNIGLFLLVAIAFIFTSHLIQRHTYMLTRSSYMDQLTKIRNRRAYEEEIAQLSSEVLTTDMVYINADVNGLKKVNDTLGHAAGDELIKGAAECLQKAFERYGHVFRIGGDEFAAILHMTPAEYVQAKENLQHILDHWHGALVDEIFIAVGYVPVWENEVTTLDEIIQEADKKMYLAKEEFYSQPGRERRRN